MAGSPWASLVLCVSLCTTAAVAPPAFMAAVAAAVEQDADRDPGEVFRDWVAEETDHPRTRSL